MIRIRLSQLSDLERLMEIFDYARHFMASVGNGNQWINGYPSRELIAREITDRHCYVCEDGNGKLVGTFCFVPSPDPFYAVIEDGAWLNDEPYYVIHRIASDGSHKGIGNICLDWCSKQYANLRADTHQDNIIMQNLLTRNGFVRCGIVYVSNGTARIAYQKTDRTNTASE